MWFILLFNTATLCRELITLNNHRAYFVDILSSPKINGDRWKRSRDLLNIGRYNITPVDLVVSVPGYTGLNTCSLKFGTDKYKL